jgi:hypothetical protein
MKTEYLVSSYTMTGCIDLEIFNSKIKAMEWILDQPNGRYIITEIFNQNRQL